MSGLLVQGLTYAIKPRAILSGVDLEARAGEIVGLIGPNGAGKTSALRAILGLVPASAAKISVADKDVRAMSHKERARSLSYLPQSREVYWPISARALVALGRFPHGDAENRAGESAVLNAMAAADVLALRSRDVRTLSGGELARVLLARALCVEAPVLLADEPVAALDPGHQLLAMAQLKEAAKRSGVVVVMHDLSLAARFCDRLYLLHEGAVAASGPSREVIASPALEKAFGIRLARAEVNGVPLIAPVW